MRAPLPRALRVAALVFTALTLLTPPASSAPAFVLPAGEVVGTAPEVEVLEDPAGTLRFAEVAADPSRFARRPGGLNVGYTPSTFWIRFGAENHGADRRVLLVELRRAIDYLDLHEIRDGTTRTHSTGNRRPFGSREISDADFVFRTPIEPGQRVVYYARLQSSDTFDLSPKLWTEPAFREHVRGESLADGLYFGLMLALILYNLFVFVATRASAYGPYLVFQICYATLIAIFDRYPFQYLWPDSPDWNARSEVVFGSAAFTAGVWFARSFLDLSRYLPRLDRLLAVVMATGAVLLPIGALTAHSWVQQTTLYVAMVSLVATVSVAIVGWLRGIPNARFLAIAFLFLSLLTVADTLVTAGVLERPAIQTLPLRIGSGAEALLLAFALANRINVAQRDKERAFAELAESRKVYAETLENRVEERTQELRRAHDDLKTAQVALARKERMTSLGRLVAGVAHEVNNPLTFSAGGAAKLRGELGVVGRFLRSHLDQDEATPDPEVARAREACATAELALDLVDAGNQRIGAIVSNLHSYVKSGPTDPVPIDITEELRSILGLVTDELEKSNVRLVDEIAPLPPCTSRPGELGQVFLNLIVNACHAQRSGGGTLTLSTGSDEESVWVRFADTGPGVPAELGDRIFEPFFTTREPGEGTGLGLSVSQEIAARHGGELRLIPSETGAVFEVRLPRADG